MRHPGLHSRAVPQATAEWTRSFSHRRARTHLVGAAFPQSPGGNLIARPAITVLAHAAPVKDELARVAARHSPAGRTSPRVKATGTSFGPRPGAELGAAWPRGDSIVKKLLLLALLPLLSAGLAHADDNAAACPAGADALGVSRVVEIDTNGGPTFGDQYPPRPEPLLQKGEVVLTFDDGPHPAYTRQILAALAAQCTKATFFNVGEMVKQFPDIAREVEAAGHTIGTHTWSHRNLASLSLDGAKQQIESTIAEEDKVLAHGVAPFFRFPYLSDPKRVREYLATRNIAVFSIDVDSFDWRVKSPEKLIDNVLSGLQKTGGGIILMHDYHEVTTKALPTVLSELKSHGYHVVHMVPKARVEVVAIAEPAAEPAPRRRAYRHHRKARRH